MQWRVVKMGSAFFDALHVYGLAIVLATLTKQPVTLQDAGISYELTSPMRTLARGTLDLFDKLFPLPTEDQCALALQNHLQEFPLTILDGLLAALLTYPHAPLKANIHDLFLAQRFQPQAIPKGLQKVAHKISDWKAWLQQRADDPTNWVAEMLRDYAWDAPVVPVLFAGQSKRDLHVLMTLDPSFAYSFHQAIHTGDMTQKTNVAIHGTRYAALLAFIGAARFLRSCSVVAPSLLFFVPIVERGVIAPETSLPCLSPERVSPDLALVRRWLAFFTVPVLPDCSWHSLAYQTLQQQKQQQPLCGESGQLLFSWLRRVKREAGAEVLTFWQHCLQSGDPDEQKALVAVLKQQHLASWYRHLRQRTSLLLVAAPSTTLRRYRFEEVRSLTAMLDPSASHPLRAVLERRDKGTVRFGHALRLLLDVRPNLRRDLLGRLEPVSTEEEFFPVLTRIVEACADAKLRERYIIVPTDDDFPLLLDDIQQHGLRQIIGVLLVLSALHYSSPEEVKKYELGTLIRALLALITSTSSQGGHQSEEISPSVEPLLADETVLLLSQEEEIDESLQ